VEGFLSIDALLASTQTIGRLQCKKPESQKWTEWCGTKRSSQA